MTSIYKPGATPEELRKLIADLDPTTQVLPSGGWGTVEKQTIRKYLKPDKAGKDGDQPDVEKEKTPDSS